jgi:transcriptional regulator GlxA family with amidase domain
MLSKARKTVAVVVYRDVAVFEMAVPCEVFGIDRSAMGAPNYELRICAAEPPPLLTQAGFTLDTPHDLSALETADVVIVPAWRDIREVPPEPLLQALRDAHQRGSRIASLCSGAFVLAHAGLLDGLSATTHWMYAARLAELFPQVRVDPSVLYIDEGQVLTSAGTAAGIDLCLHMVRQDYGAEVANLFARRMVVPPHRSGGQAQYVETPLPPSADDDPLGGTLTWAVEHLAQALTVEAMAARAHLSSRTFARRFLAVTGNTPLRWLLTQRVAAAQRLLETSDLSVDRVADACGLGSAANLRLHFGRVVGISPTAYRKTFRRRVQDEAAPDSSASSAAG